MQAEKEKGTATNDPKSEGCTSQKTTSEDSRKDSTDNAEVNLNEEDGSETIGVDELFAFNRKGDPSTLIGQRWLCKGKQAVIQGPTGVGKSSLTMQWSIRLVLGLPFFGIVPVKAMRVLIIQAENDRGDMAEAFQDMYSAMSDSGDIGDDGFEKLRQGLTIVNDDEHTGLNFVKFLEKKIKKHNPDIVFVDPYLAYIGADALRQEIASKFLRNQINPVLRKSNALLIWIHHTGKPSGSANGKEKTAEENKYSGLGSSELQNVCREVLTLTDVGGGGIYMLSLGKRGKRAGLADEEGNPITRFNIEHHKNGICWIASKGHRIHATKGNSRKILGFEKLKAEIENRKTMTREQIITWATQNGNGLGGRAAVDYAKSLTQDEGSGIYMYKLDPIIGIDGKKAKGEPPTVFSTIRPKWMPPEDIQFA